MRRINILLSSLIVFLLSACFQDEGNYDYVKVEDITIDNVKETYQVITFAGRHLEIEPAVTSKYEDLEYEWYMYSVEKDKDYHTDGYAAELIGTEKNLSYEVTEKEGDYVVFLKVTSKSNNYSVYAKTTMEAVTEYTRGFYVMKENADGDTDLDIYSGDFSFSDLLKFKYGKAVSGSPLHLDVLYRQTFIDPETEEASGANTLCITTKAGEVVSFRTSDLVKVMDRSTMFYEPLAGDIPYRMVRGSMGNYYISSTGIYSIYGADVMPSSGQFGDATTESGGSVHGIVAGAGSYLIVWSEIDHLFDAVDFNGTGGYTSNEGVLPVRDLDYECITAGNNIIGSGNNASETNYFLMQSKSNPNEKSLFYFKFNDSYTWIISKVVKLDSSSKFANGTCYAVNGQSATLAYCITGNKLYAYDLAGGTEWGLTLEDLPGNEQITYISNQFWEHPDDADHNFDYLMVGTQDGNTYHLYMYKMVGGQPDGKPALTYTGTGKLSGVQYVSPKWTQSPYYSYPRVD